jgi:hypothetical protein
VQPAAGDIAIFQAHNMHLRSNRFALEIHLKTRLDHFGNREEAGQPENQGHGEGTPCRNPATIVSLRPETLRPRLYSMFAKLNKILNHFHRMDKCRATVMAWAENSEAGMGHQS